MSSIHSLGNILTIPPIRSDIFRNSRPLSSESIEFHPEFTSPQKRKVPCGTTPLRASRHEITRQSKLIFSEALTPQRSTILPSVSASKPSSIREFIFEKPDNSLSSQKLFSLRFSSSYRSIKTHKQILPEPELKWKKRNKKRGKKNCTREGRERRQSENWDQPLKTAHLLGVRTPNKHQPMQEQIDNFQQRAVSQHPKQGMNKQDFRIIKRLGKGCFGEVFLAVVKQTGFLVALKVMEKRRLLNENYLSQVIREIKIQSFFSNPYITELYGVFDDSEFIYLAMELCAGETLYSMIRREHKLSQQQTRSIILGITKGVKVLHSETVIHRDLKPENIMLSFGAPKITDFGWTVYCGPQDGLRGTLSGSPLYHSPELVERRPYDEKIDTWAIGMMAYECLLGMTPFKVYSLMNLHRIVEDEPSFPEYAQISEMAKSFILGCLEKVPSHRLTARQLLTHQFLKHEDESTHHIQMMFPLF